MAAPPARAIWAPRFARNAGLPSFVSAKDWSSIESKCPASPGASPNQPASWARPSNSNNGFRAPATSRHSASRLRSSGRAGAVSDTRSIARGRLREELADGAGRVGLRIGELEVDHLEDRALVCGDVAREREPFGGRVRLGRLVLGDELRDLAAQALHQEVARDGRERLAQVQPLAPLLRT